MFRTIMTASIAVALLAGAPAAFADRNVIFETTAVKYGDLDLSNPIDASSLLQRMKFAVRKVCGVNSGRRGLQESSDAKACMTKSLNLAIAAIDSPILTTMHTGGARQVMLASR